MHPCGILKMLSRPCSIRFAVGVAGRPGQAIVTSHRFSADTAHPRFPKHATADPLHGICFVLQVFRTLSQLLVTHLFPYG